MYRIRQTHIRSIRAGLWTAVCLGVCAILASNASPAEAQFSAFTKPITRLFKSDPDQNELDQNEPDTAIEQAEPELAPATGGAPVLPPPIVITEEATAQVNRLPAIPSAPEFIAPGQAPVTSEPQAAFHYPPGVPLDGAIPPLDPHYQSERFQSERFLPEESVVAIQSHVASSPAAHASQDRVTLVVRDTALGTVLAMIAEQHGLNIVTSAELAGTVSLALNNVPLGETLDAILKVNGYTWSMRGSLLVVSSLGGESRHSPFSQGRELRIFTLSFRSAGEIDRVVQGLLSPAGQSFIAEIDPTNKQFTREQLVVEDLPEYLDRIAAYVEQADRPPRQVLIEAHILEVELKDELAHGVDLGALLRLSDTRVSFGSNGIANPLTSPSFFFGIDGTDLDGLLEMIRTTTDAKTLASPKVLALNGQEARIQIGERFGYFITTTTQTSTLQSVEFLDVGVVLTVTPVISPTGQVLMSVKPEVSGGRINPASGLPESDTSEVETSVLLEDGQAMIIGGLIQEEDTEIQNKVPYLGDMWKIGRLFQKRSVVRDRSEIIVALVPRVVPYSCDVQCQEEVDISRAMTPLTTGPLRPVDRRAWEPELPDAIRNPVNR